MALLNPAAYTGPGGPFVTAENTLQALASPVTTGYTASTNAVICVGWEKAVVRIPYTPGNETSMLVKPEGSTDGGATWTPLGFKAVQGSGTSIVTKDIVQLDAASYSGVDGVYSPPITLGGVHQFRCSFKAIGGTPTGTIGAYVVFSKTMTK